MSLSEQLPLGLATETEGYWDSSDWWDYSDRSEWRSSSMRRGRDFWELPLGLATRRDLSIRKTRKNDLGRRTLGATKESIQ